MVQPSESRMKLEFAGQHLAALAPLLLLLLLLPLLLLLLLLLLLVLVLLTQLLPFGT